MFGCGLSAGSSRLLATLILSGFLTLGTTANAAPLPGVFKGDAYGSIQAQLELMAADEPSPQPGEPPNA